MTTGNFFIDNLLKDDLVAAPLAGISHLPFRRILRKFFKGIVYSEMCSVEGIMRKNPDSLEYLDRTHDESPLVFQLFGGKAESFSEAVKVACDYTKIDAFDINMGCPVKKVLKAGGGCALLRDLPRMKEIVRSMRKASPVPFSIKIRIGLDDKNLMYKEALDIAQSEGADAIIVHGRTRAAMFGGTVRLDILQEIAESASIPVIGNGGVTDKATYDEMKKTGVQGIMVGRAMMKSPWVFKTIKDNRPLENYLSPNNIAMLLSDMWTYMTDYAADDTNKRGHYLHILRKFAVWFSKGLKNAADFRVKIYQTQNEQDVLNIINGFFINTSYDAIA